MAESFLFNIAERVLVKITTLTIQEVGLAWFVQSDLKKLRTTLTSIKAVLMDAERQQHHNEDLRLSLGKLRDIFYDAEDVIDEFECEALQKEVGSSTNKLVRCFTTSCSMPVVFSFKMGHRIREINERLNTIAVEWRRFNLGEQVDSRHVIYRETHSFVNSSDVMGRQEDKENIIDFLMKKNKDENIPVIPIVGIGGLGKTTLAQFVYNDDRITKLFPLKIWVWVSKEFDLAKLLTKIINSISKKKYDGLPIDKLQNHLRGLLNHKKFLLVLDDVWNEDRVQWNDLRNLLMMMGNSGQSKIIVTTRSSKVAAIMGTVSPYYLKALTLPDCVSLFIKWAFRDGDEEKFPNLKRIGDEIVTKCKGVPLALRTLGCLLFSKTEQREWELIRDNEIWRFEQNENDIFPVLKLSYDHLPSHLQRCLAYLSLFPKDHLYDTDYIIQFWMANGLLESPTSQDEQWEDIGIRCFKKLWLRSFVQDVTDCGSFYLFKIHDLIHDLLLNLSQQECLMINRQTIDIVEEIRHLSFSTDSSLGVTRGLKKLKRLRTVVVLPLPSSKEIRSIDESFVNACILNFKYLRVLDLSYTLLEALPKSIGKLKHLRYLDLTLCRRMTRLPASICKLQSLLTLRLLGVPLIELPEKLQRLISLRFLEFTTEALVLRDIQPGCWQSLQLLHLYECDMLQSVFNGMQYLTSLRRLTIRNCSGLMSLPRTLKFLTKLEQIDIGGCQNINLFMEPDGREDGDLHLRLKTLTISGAEALEDLPRLLLQGSASNFQFMLIRSCPNFKFLPEWIQTLTSLEKLELVDCPLLSSLPDGLSRLSALRQVKIQDCPALTEKCEPGVGADWYKIAHAQEIHIEHQRVIKPRSRISYSAKDCRLMGSFRSLASSFGVSVTYIDSAVHAYIGCSQPRWLKTHCAVHGLEFSNKMVLKTSVLYQKRA